MKKNYKLINGYIIVLILIIMIYSYFHVSGSEIEGVSIISATSEATIKKRHHLSAFEDEYILNGQIEMLKDLILESTFTRNLSASVRFHDIDMYYISINDNEAGLWLSIHCIGNEWISIPNQFSGKHLKINNPNWKEKLEEIILLSD